MIKISTPGRICLFGEHQDYLGLPVISMAISKRCRISGNPLKSNEIIIKKPNINQIERFKLNNLNYTKKRDYFKSGLKIAIDEGLIFESGFECEIKSQIPIQAGISSSSAIMVSWIHFLSKVAKNQKNWSKEKIGELAYKAEVEEFHEPGGIMDQISTSVGGLIYLDTYPFPKIEQIITDLGPFVIGDSLESKKTITILKRCKNLRVSVIDKIKKINPSFDLKNVLITDLEKYNLSIFEKNLLIGTIKNRDFLQQAKNELKNSLCNKNLIGDLMNKHHSILRDTLNISTPKIEKLIKVSLKSGAFGAKINGSGGGGCMIAYAPENPEMVVDAINKNGGKGYIVNCDIGTTQEV